MDIELIFAIISSIICFLLGLAVGSAGKASETERADYAVGMAETYRQKYLDEIDKIDLMR